MFNFFSLYIMYSQMSNEVHLALLWYYCIITDKLNEVQLEVGADKIEKGATWFCHQGNLGLLHKTNLL